VTKSDQTDRQQPWWRGLSGPLLTLTGFTLLVWGISAIVASRQALLPASAGLLICLPVALLTLVLVLLVSRRWPLFGPLSALVATGLRLGWAVTAVYLLRKWAESYGTNRTTLAEWTTGFYLVTLLVETALLYRTLSK